MRGRHQQDLLRPCIRNGTLGTDFPFADGSARGDFLFTDGSARNVPTPPRRVVLWSNLNDVSERTVSAKFGHWTTVTQERDPPGSLLDATRRGRRGYSACRAAASRTESPYAGGARSCAMVARYPVALSDKIVVDRPWSCMLM